MMLKWPENVFNHVFDRVAEMTYLFLKIDKPLNFIINGHPGVQIKVSRAPLRSFQAIL